MRVRGSPPDHFQRALQHRIPRAFHHRRRKGDVGHDAPGRKVAAGADDVGLGIAHLEACAGKDEVLHGPIRGRQIGGLLPQEGREPMILGQGRDAGGVRIGVPVDENEDPSLESGAVPGLRHGHGKAEGLAGLVKGIGLGIAVADGAFGHVGQTGGIAGRGGDADLQAEIGGEAEGLGGEPGHHGGAEALITPEVVAQVDEELGASFPQKASKGLVQEGLERGGIPLRLGLVRQVHEETRAEVGHPTGQHLRFAGQPIQVEDLGLSLGRVPAFGPGPGGNPKVDPGAIGPPQGEAELASGAEALPDQSRKVVFRLGMEQAIRVRGDILPEGRQHPLHGLTLKAQNLIAGGQSRGAAEVGRHVGPAFEDLEVQGEELPTPFREGFSLGVRFLDPGMGDPAVGREALKGIPGLGAGKRPRESCVHPLE